MSDYDVNVGGPTDYDNLMASVGAEPPPPQHYEVGAPPRGYYPQQQQQPYPQHYGPPPGPPQHYLPAPQQQYVQQQPRQIVQQVQGRQLVQEAPTKSRDYPIGFVSSQPIAPGTAPVEIEVKPQVRFKGKRLSVAHSIAKDFVIVDIKVGTNPQQAATGEMPAESFSSQALDTRVEFDTAAPGTTITIRVRNIGQTPLVFMATLFGAVLA